MVSRCLPFFLLGVLVSGCASKLKGPDPVEFNKAALEATVSAKIGVLKPGSEEEREAISRFKDFFSVLSEKSVKDKIAATYAKDAYFHDTLKGVRGAAALEKYLIESAHGVDSCTVDFLDSSSKDGEYYFRWKMHIVFKRFRKGRKQTSLGMTHIRFDKDGKVAFHQDYWDAANGLFEKVPVVGGMIRWIKNRL